MTTTSVRSYLVWLGGVSWAGARRAARSRRVVLAAGLVIAFLAILVAIRGDQYESCVDASGRRWIEAQGWRAIADELPGPNPRIYAAALELEASSAPTPAGRHAYCDRKVARWIVA